MPKYLKYGRVSVKFLMTVSIIDTKKLIIILFFILFQLVMLTDAFGGISFGKAKSLLKSKVYGDKNKTFYCKCSYQKKSIKLKTCKILSKKYKKRMKRLEWEHVVPAHSFGQSFSQWREAKKICPKTKSKRKCAAKKSKLFKEMEGNLHNLVPAVGGVNALRSNFSFTATGVGKNKKEICQNRFWIEKRKASVAKDIRGDIARIYFYMNKTYPNRGIISNKNRKLFKAWNREDPVTKDECELSRKKTLLQGSKNNFVEDFCK